MVVRRATRWLSCMNWAESRILVVWLIYQRELDYQAAMMFWSSVLFYRAKRLGIFYCELLGRG